LQSRSDPNAFQEALAQGIPVSHLILSHSNGHIAHPWASARVRQQCTRYFGRCALINARKQVRAVAITRPRAGIDACTEIRHHRWSSAARSRRKTARLALKSNDSDFSKREAGQTGLSGHKAPPRTNVTVSDFPEHWCRWHRKALSI